VNALEHAFSPKHCASAAWSSRIGCTLVKQWMVAIGAGLSFRADRLVEEVERCIQRFQR
jgi:hypothetical protein